MRYELLPERCSYEVWQKSGKWGQLVQCSRKWTVERDGKHYCKQHDPEEQKKRDQASRERYLKENEAWIAEFRLKKAVPKMLDALKTLILDNDFRCSDTSRKLVLNAIESAEEG